MAKAQGIKQHIDQETKLEQQIVDYLKKNVLQSRIILDEDFEVVIEAPLIFPPIPANRQHLSISVAVSTVVLFTSHALRKPWYYSTAALVPTVFEVYTLLTRCLKKRRSYRAIDEYINALGNMHSLVLKIVKHLYMRLRAIEELEHKINAIVEEMIQGENKRFANFAATTLEDLCRSIQKQIVIQSTYSQSHYQFIGSCPVEACVQNASLQQTTDFIERIGEFYLLLASNLMSSSVFALEAAMWRSHQDYKIVFKTFTDTTELLTTSIRDLEKKLAEIVYDLSTTTEYERPKCVLEKQTVYKEVMYDCTNRLRIVYDLARCIEQQDADTRLAFLEDMLKHYEHSMMIVKNLKRYELGSRPVEQSQMLLNKSCEADQIKGRGNEEMGNEEEPVGSDDELFAYSPHDSDDDEMPGKSFRKVGDGDSEMDSSAAIAVQSLMLQELRGRMKDVRRLKITKNANGDLLVQERPLTLQQSGGEPDVDVNKLDISPMENVDVNTPLPKSFTLLTNEPASVSDLPKDFLSSISSIAKQRAPAEDVFDYVGEDYIDSDEREGDNEEDLQ